MKLRLSITAKLTLVFVLFAALLLVGVGALAYTSGRTALETAITSDLLSTAIEKEAALNAWVEDQQLDIIALTHSPDLVENVAAFVATPNQTRHDRVVHALQTWAGPGQQYLALLVIDAETGQVIAATDPLEEGKFKENRPYFINGKNGPYVQNIYYSLVLQGPAMTAAAPLRSAEGRLLGVLAGRLNLEELNAIINRRTGLHQTDAAFLANTSNLFVTQPRFISDPAVLRRGVHTEHVKRCLARNSGFLFAEDYRGTPVIAVYRWLPERQLCLVVKLDQAEALAPAYAFGQTILLIGSLALLAGSVLAVGLARTITRPVLALQAGAVRLGGGELDVRLSETSGDELGQLAREFNSMAAALLEKETQLRRYTEELEQIVQERTIELQESEIRFRRLTENAQDVIYRYRIKPTSGFEYVSPAATAITGYTPEEYYADPELGLKLVHPDDRLMLQQLGDAERFDQPLVLRWQRKDGIIIWSEQRNVPIYDEAGQLIAIEGIARDITSRKQAEEEIKQMAVELTRSNAELEQFAYVASHDLQEPLRAVAGTVQLLQQRYQGKLDARADEFIAHAVDGVTRMQALINDLLAFSRVGTRGQPFKPTDCLASLTAALTNLATPIQESKAVVTHDSLPTVMADPTQMAQLFQNLIGNAIKFRNADRPKIRITVEHQKDEWLFAVRDNGIGIEPQYFERIFGVFQRLHTRRVYPGTGIGLAICKKIVERHKGRIWLESEPGQGSIFYFTIPSVELPAPILETEAQPEKQVKREDDTMTRRMRELI